MRIVLRVNRGKWRRRQRAAAEVERRRDRIASDVPVD